MTKEKASKNPNKLKPMTKKRALKILIEYQRWRRGEGPYSWDGESRDIPVSFTDAVSPKDLGKAIDIAIKTMQRS